jgi:hypothetical protein
VVNARALDCKLVRDLWRWRGQLTAIALIVACGMATFVAMCIVYRSLHLTQATYYGHRDSRSVLRGARSRHGHERRRRSRVRIEPAKSSRCSANELLRSET